MGSGGHALEHNASRRTFFSVVAGTCSKERFRKPKRWVVGRALEAIMLRIYWGRRRLCLAKLLMACLLYEGGGWMPLDAPVQSRWWKPK